MYILLSECMLVLQEGLQYMTTTATSKPKCVFHYPGNSPEKCHVAADAIWPLIGANNKAKHTDSILPGYTLCTLELSM